MENKISDFWLHKAQNVRACHKFNLLYYSKMGKWLLAYRIRNSEFFAWDRNSYLTHVISPMGRIEKENYHVDSVCICCIGRHVTLSLGWRHCDVTMTSNLKNVLCRRHFVRWSQMSRLMTKPTMWLCAQRRLRSAWASAQSGQSFAVRSMAS